MDLQGKKIIFRAKYISEDASPPHPHVKKVNRWVNLLNNPEMISRMYKDWKI